MTDEKNENRWPTLDGFPRHREERRTADAVACAALGALVTLLSLAPAAAAEEPGPSTPPQEKRSRFKDPQDGAVDLSGWLATKTGVLPIVSPITEPAVGLGGAVALVLFSGGGLAGALKAPLGPSGKPVPPDISFVGGGLTENGTWAALAGYFGHFKNDRWRYKGGVSRLSPNLDFYGANDRSYRFNMDGWAVYQELGRRVGKTDLFAGLRFVWLDTTVLFETEEVPDEVPGLEFDSKQSGLGPFVEIDTRNNSLTPSSGLNLKLSATFYGSWIGGDSDFERYKGVLKLYWDPRPRLVLAARLQAESAGGKPPFYAHPYITLRGIPAMRYQGDGAYSVDGEVRWNAWKRWWLVAFAGAGWSEDAPGLEQGSASVTAGGLGFRYLVARALGLHAGLDVGKGPEETAIYVVAGSSF